MILMFNVKITNVRFLNYRREQNPMYPQNNRVDIFKYCLSSYSVLSPLLSKCYFFIEVAPEFKDREQEIGDYINQIYPSDKINLKWYRNNYVSDWLKVCEEINEIDDEIIWLLGNDDHIFLDSSLDIIKDGIEILKNDPDPLAMLTVSHWPEVIKVANYLRGELHPNGNFVKVKWSNSDSLHVITKQRFNVYWKEVAEPDKLNFRPDSICDHSNPKCKRNVSTFCDTILSNVYISTKELVRHFDGYGHIGNLNNINPPLYIPFGFFENDIKIKFGYKQRFEGYTNLDPTNKFLYCVSPEGTDYRWCLEDIPLFWRDKISSVDKNDVSDREMKLYRNAYMNMSMKNHIHWCFGFFMNNIPPPPDEWINKHLLT